MNILEQTTVLINNEWDIIIARQKGRRLAGDIGFGIVDCSRITTIISELARNIYFYTKGGEIIIKKVIKSKDIEIKGIHIRAQDQGPGIDNIKLVLEDGFSTIGGLGSGLPGIKRMVDKFDIDSQKDVGTVVSVYKWLKPIM